MKRSQRMSLVLDLAKRKEETALKALQKANAYVAEQKKMLDDLSAYQAEYLDRIRSEGGTGLSVARMQSYQNFLSQLSTAIAQQKQRLASAEQKALEVRRQWQLLHEKQRGMRKFVDQCVEEEVKAADKKEQQMIDELSQRKR